MKMKLCDVTADAASPLPQFADDKSGIGVHYVDAYLKPMNTTLPGGAVVRCKRRGLKVVLSVGDRKGEGLMRRLDRGPDPVVMLEAALQEAAAAAGVAITIDQGAIFIDVEPGGP
jgi:hypothetical protein